MSLDRSEVYPCYLHRGPSLTGGRDDARNLGRNFHRKFDRAVTGSGNGYYGHRARNGSVSDRALDLCDGPGEDLIEVHFILRQ